MSSDLKTVLASTMADLEHRIADSKANRTGKPETLHELIIAVDREERLAQLLVEFEAARDVFLTSPLPCLISDPALPQKPNPFLLTPTDIMPNLVTRTVEEWASHKIGPNQMPVIEAARRYIIARDFNEFRDGKWQMTWKLTFGGQR